MAIQPRSSDAIFTQIRDALTGSISALTNFVSGTFNDLFVTAYAEQVREVEIKALAAQLSAFPEYAGKELTEVDLNRLGVSGIDPEEINEYMEDSQLDELGKLVGVTRNPGTAATGTVTIQTSADVTEVSEGFPVATEPGPGGDRKTYFVDANDDGVIDQNSTATVSPDDGETAVDVSVIAEDVGSEFNVGSNAITFLPSQEPGIRSVTNTAEITGGADVQSNESLREDITNALFENSGGGTKEGIKGAIESRTDFDVDVSIDENLNTADSAVDVIVGVTPGSSGEDAVRDIVENVRPVGIDHDVVTPGLINTGTHVEVTGSNINTTDVSDEITEYLTELSIGDTYSESRVTKRVMNAVPEIDTVSTVDSYHTTIEDEQYTYQSGTDNYQLTHAPLGVVTSEEHRYQPGTDIYPLAFDTIDVSSITVEALVDKTRTTLAAGTDYDVIDDDGDGTTDSIELLAGGADPDENTRLIVDYQHDAWSIESVSDATTTYTQGTDYDIVDDTGDGAPETIEWLSGGAEPNDGDEFVVTYNTLRSIGTEYVAGPREQIVADPNEIQVSVVG